MRRHSVAAFRLFLGLLAFMGGCGRSTLRFQNGRGSGPDVGGPGTQIVFVYLQGDGGISPESAGNLDAARGDGGRADDAAARTDGGGDARLFLDAGVDGAAGLVGIEIDPALARAAVGTDVLFRVTGRYNDGTRRDLSDVATLAVLPADIAVVRGVVVRGQKAGQGTVTARIGGAVAQAQLVVTAAPLMALAIEPQAARVNVGFQIELGVVGVFADGTKQDLGTQATWTSAQPGLASVTTGPTQPGIVRGLKVGTVTITAEVLGMTASATVTVSAAPLSRIDIRPAAPRIFVGATQAFLAIGTFSDGNTDDVTAESTWSSDNPSVLRLGPVAAGQGVSAGSALVTARVGGISGATVATVVAANRITLVIEPATASVGPGETFPFVAFATEAGVRMDVSASAIWSADSAVAVLSNAPGREGVATAVSPGTARIVAAFAGQVASAMLTVASRTVTALSLAPAMSMVNVGGTVALTARARFSDGSERDVSAASVFSSSMPDVAGVSNLPPAAGVVRGLRPGNADITATFGGQTAAATTVVTDDQLEGLRIVPLTSELHVGETLVFTGLAVSKAGATRPLPALMVQWTSSAPQIATISAAGQARCVVAGMVKITLGSMGRTSDATLVCTDPQVIDLQVTPFVATALAGTTLPFVATAVFTDLSVRDVTAQAMWTTSNPQIAVVSDAGLRGRVMAVSAGIARITAALGGQTAAALLTVSDARLVGLSLSPVLARVRVGQFAAFVATGIYSDMSVRPLTTQTTFTSSDATVADISNAAARGRAQGLAAGVVTITATHMGFSDSAKLTVSAGKIIELQITPTGPTLVVGQRLAMQAVAIFDDGTNQNVSVMTTWQSDKPAVADVSNAQARGQATALSPGSAMVTAFYMGQMAATTVTVTDAKLTEIQVTPPAPRLPQGQRQQFFAVGIYSDGTSRPLTGQATWQSSDRAVAALSNAAGSTGQATGLQMGSARVTATFGGVSGQALLTVTAATLTEIQVSPSVLSLPRGLDHQLFAVGIFSDGTHRGLTNLVTWNSSSEALATVSNAANRGLLTAVAAGQVTVTAMYEGLTGQIPVTVTDATLSSIQVTPTNMTLPQGISENFQAVGIFSDGTHLSLTSRATWNSSDESRATASNIGGRGLVTAINVGTVKISAGFGGVMGQTGLTVSDTALTEIQLSPVNAFLPAGLSQAYVAVALFADGSARSITGLCTWASSDFAVADISNAPGSAGRANTRIAGTTQISCAYLTKAARTNLRVTQAKVTEIQITPSRVTAPVGVKLQLVATAVFSDGTTQVITEAATWTSSLGASVNVSNVGGLHGLVTTLAPGAATVTATALGQTGSALITVGGQSLKTLSVTPADGTVGVAKTLNFVATGTYDDGSTYDLTSIATWTSNATNVAVVSNVDGTRGQAVGQAAGRTSIGAQVGGVSGTATLTVGP